MTTDLLPARLITHTDEQGTTFTGHANEVGPHNPALQARMMAHPIAGWVAVYLDRDRRHPNAEIHLDIQDALINTKRAAFKAPRSYAKTTKAVVEFLIFLACEYPAIKAGKYPDIFPHNRVKLLSCAGAKAEEICLDVKTELETNPQIIADYGNLAGKAVWTNRHFKTRDGFEVSASGRGAQIRGFRPTLLICDDLDDDEEVLSDERLEKAFSWWDKAVTNTIDEDDYQVFVIGTTLEEVSLLTYIANKPGWEVHRYQAYEGGIMAPGYETWPSKWPHEKLQRRKEEIGHRAFMSEFMNEPQPGEAPLFERHWFRPYSPDDAAFQVLLEKTMYTMVCCDPAISKRDGADFTANVTISVTFDEVPRIYLRTGGVKRGHWSLNRTVTEIWNLYDKFFANEVGIEKVAYQEALCDEMQRFMEQNRRNMTVDAMVPDGDKERRANSVSSYVERGLVYFDPNDPLHIRLIDECVLFKPGKLNIKKDLMDAFVYCLIKVKQWERRRHTSSGAGRVLPGNRRPHSVTGI